MTQNAASDTEEFAQWLRAVIEKDGGTLRLTDRATDQMARHGIDLLDIHTVLRRCEHVTRDYGGGCFTVRGGTIDEICVAVVVTPKNDRERVKVVTVWKE